MDSDALLQSYDEQLRAEAEVTGADEVERIGPLWLATFPARHRGFVTYRELPDDATEVDGLVAAALAHYRADTRVDEFEWKTRGHDAPPGLLELLGNRGFQLEERETVMAGDVDAAIAADPGVAHGYRLERATTGDQVRAAEALAGRVFGDDPARSAQRGAELADRLERDPEGFEMWMVAGADGDVVCSGRIDFVAGTDWAGLWGGACDEDHRGRGLYRALTGARARSAAARGKRFLQSDCTEFSRPILQRAGLVPITTSTPAVWHREG